MTGPGLRKFHVIIVVVAALVVYLNSLGNKFVFDDESVILGDKSITSLDNIPKFFKGEMGFHKVIGKYYRPVVSSSYTVDYSLWNYNPFGFHFTNVLIHTINSVIFYFLLFMIFGKERKSSWDYMILGGAVIFAVHPIHTEAVAWVSGRTDSLCAMFYFSAFVFYIKFSEEKKSGYVLMLSTAYMLALMSKEMALTLPVIIILYDVIVKGRKINENYRIYVLLVILTIIYLIIRWYALRGVPDRPGYYYFYGKDNLTVLFTMLQTIPLYFRLSILPYSMIYHYGGYLPYQNSLFNFNVLFGLGFVILILITSLYLLRKLPVVSYSLLFFIVTLLPVLNIVPTMNFMADRFLYIPSAFLSFLLTEISLKYYNPHRKYLFGTLAMIIILTYSIMTFNRNLDWRDNDTLFMSAAGKPGNVIYVNIGNMFANKGQYDQAEVYYRKAIDLKDQTLLANTNLGKIFMLRGNFDSAFYYMNKAYLLDTLSPEPPMAIAQLYAFFNDPESSIPWLEKVQALSPGYMNSDKMLEEMKGKVNHPDKLDREHMGKISVLENSSYLHYQAKNYSMAIKELEELIKLNPEGSAGYYNNIGMCYLEQKEFSLAKLNFEKAVKYNPEFSTAYNNLGNCYEQMGDIENASRFYSRALEVDPSNSTAAENLNRLRK